MFKPGLVCYKTAGHEAKKVAVVVEVVDDDFVIIDGNVKRRKCNVKHLEAINQVLDIKKGASTSEVHKQMSVAGFKVIERKPKKEEPKTEEKEVKEKKKQTKKK